MTANSSERLFRRSRLPPPILPGVPQALAHDLHAMARAQAYNDWLIDRARPWLRGRVLDVGAGIGTHTIQLRGLADEVVALEPDPQFAQMLRDRVDGVQIVEGDATDVPGPFDAIVCFNVLEHIEDDESTLRRLRELLASHGALLLLVPAHPTLFGPIDTAFGHYRRYGKGELRRKLRGAGLDPAVLRPFGLALPMVGPIPLGLLNEASAYLSNRTIRLRVTGTIKAPAIAVNPVALLSESAVRFFVAQSGMPVPTAAMQAPGP